MLTHNTNSNIGTNIGGRSYSYHHNGIPEKFEFCGPSYLTLDSLRTFGHEINGTMDSLVVVSDDTPPQVCPICPGI